MTATTQHGAPHDETSLLVYFVLPVPLAAFGLSIGTAMAEGLPHQAVPHDIQPSDIAVILLVVCPLATLLGYFAMWLHSLLFALVMCWLERCRAWWSMRYFVATLAGALAGYLAPIPFLLELPRIPFVLVGAWTGMATNLCVHLLANRAAAHRRRRAAVALLAALAVTGVGGIIAQRASDAWISHLRDQVHAEIRPGMSSAEVERLAGTPRVETALRDQDSQGDASIVWVYDEYDPGPRPYLRVRVRFRDDKVVDVQRTPMSRD